MPDPITVSCVVANDVQSAWSCFTDPEAIRRWNFASEEWACPAATTDLRTGGTFRYTMAARDGSMSFDFAGTWAEVTPTTRLVQTLGDGRQVQITFEATAEGTRVTQTFDPDDVAPRDMQQAGWQAILDRFATVAAG